VPYTTQALREDLLRLRNAWEESQARRERDAIYTYLTAVFELVAWWMAENRALERAHKALRLRHINPFDDEEPFAAIIRSFSRPAASRAAVRRLAASSMAAHRPVKPILQIDSDHARLNESLPHALQLRPVSRHTRLRCPP
jgi:hypothetical protein